MAITLPTIMALSCRPPQTPNTTALKQRTRTKQQQTMISTTKLHNSVRTATLLSFMASSVGDAKAFSLPKEDILSSLDKVESTIEQVQDVSAKVFDVAISVIETLKPGVDAVVPVLQSASQEALKVASPVASDASKLVNELLQSAGIDPSSVLTAAKVVADAAGQTTTFIETAKPIASATVEKIITSDPSVIVSLSGILFIAYLIVPPLWSSISFNFRGYKGNLSPAQVLNLISSKDYIIIDIRSEKEKNKAGIPRLPSSAKNKLISLPLEELPSKIKGLVSNPKQVEADIAAIKIAYLKQINKGSNIVIMDSYSDIAKTVAKTLTRLGFGNAWIMTGGFSGRNGWLQSELGADSYNVSVAEIISPSRLIPAASTRFSTVGSAAVKSTQKFIR